MRLSESTILDDLFVPVMLQELLLFMLVLGREGGSWDKVSMCCDNVKPAN